MKKLLCILTMLCMSVFITSTASAYFIFNDWTLDVGGIDGLVDSDGYLYSDVDQIGFTGAAHSVTDPDTGAGYTEGILYATDMIGASNPTSGLNQTQFVYDAEILSGFEMTFEFMVESQITATFPDGYAFEHTGLGDIGTGVSMNVYIDNLNDGSGLEADRDTGLGFDDGQLVATFQVLPGDGGIYTTSTMDGSDDATFALVWAEAGVFSFMGQDLADWVLGGGLATIALTDSNYDADDDNNGIQDSTYGQDIWTIPDVQDAFNQVVSEDGSASLGVVPEPTTMFLFGFGLLGIASVSRRKKNMA